MKENLTSKTGHFHFAKSGHYHVAGTELFGTFSFCGIIVPFILYFGEKWLKNSSSPQMSLTMKKKEN